MPREVPFYEWRPNAPAVLYPSLADIDRILADVLRKLLDGRSWWVDGDALHIDGCTVLLTKREAYVLRELATP